ncbi:hypothetical protein DYB28_001455 [Aphanomyces astaci]|uniref:Uncharacterized protein n=1 Tax=Aphanomyces astaci TaxID=112090 RepID=A0A397CSW4_APHAT|nr:hypothetical protein DYB36_006434 [Aphanomyces astaci]RHY20551.1 hypothetical protein DYB25_002105 [Aphanomyces astaci]RHY48127.1 hypothetical protein DYB34_009906 [Aphanomyces astaci]RHY49299.1 hypothetical protein DYB30_002364 [Aphanomyces astaci]RHY68406.1 hypothetical protein DYB38_009701 [Aphanomyces astaci]
MRREESTEATTPLTRDGDVMRRTFGEKKKPTRFIVTDAPDDPEVLFSPRNVGRHGASSIIGEHLDPSVPSRAQQGTQHVRIRQGKMEQKGRFTIIDLLPSSPKSDCDSHFDAAQFNYALSGNEGIPPGFDGSTVVSYSRCQAKYSSESVMVDMSVQYDPHSNVPLDRGHFHSSRHFTRDTCPTQHDEWVTALDGTPVTQFPSRHSRFFHPVEPTYYADALSGHWDAPSSKDTLSEGLLSQLIGQASENQRLLEDMVLQNDSILREFEKMNRPLQEPPSTGSLDHHPSERDSQDDDEAAASVPVFRFDARSAPGDSHGRSPSPKNAYVVTSPRQDMRPEFHFSSQHSSVASSTAPSSDIECDSDASPSIQASRPLPHVSLSKPNNNNSTICISSAQVVHGPSDPLTADDEPPARFLTPGSEALEDMMISQALHLMSSFSVEANQTATHSTAATPPPPPPPTFAGGGVIQQYNSFRPMYHTTANPPVMTGAASNWNTHVNTTKTTTLFPGAATYKQPNSSGSIQSHLTAPHQYLHISQSITTTTNGLGNVYTTKENNSLDVFQCLDPLCQPSSAAPSLGHAGSFTNVPPSNQHTTPFLRPSAPSKAPMEESPLFPFL